MDAVWDGRSDGSRDEAGNWVWNQSMGRGNFEANVGHAIVQSNLTWKMAIFNVCHSPY